MNKLDTMTVTTLMDKADISLRESGDNEEWTLYNEELFKRNPFDFYEDRFEELEERISKLEKNMRNHQHENDGVVIKTKL